MRKKINGIMVHTKFYIPLQGWENTTEDANEENNARDILSL